MLDIEQLLLGDLKKECFKELRKFDTKIAEELSKLSWDESHRPFLIQVWKMARTTDSNFDYWRRELHELSKENERLLEYLSTGDEKIIKNLISNINKRNKQREVILSKLPS